MKNQINLVLTYEITDLHVKRLILLVKNPL